MTTGYTPIYRVMKDGHDITGRPAQFGRGVIAGDDFNNVVFVDVHVSLVYTTSAAKLTILKKPRSRSSRATAPKIRVPRGFCSASISTTALRSKRT